MSAPEVSAEPGLVRVCRLAEGGMARVDLAIKRAGSFRRMYAVKRLHPHLASDPEFRQMFLDEAKIAGLIRHPNVVGVLDVGQDELGPFLVMDYVDGLPLVNLINLARQAGEQLPVQVAVRVALDIARGLHAAHQLTINGATTGVVHRDLSPQNVMVGFDGQARLTDFGIAKALGHGAKTATGVVKGKTSYLSPEQIRSEEPDRRSDLFSFGIVVFEMLSGERLYKRSDASSDMHAIIEEPVPDIGELRSDVPDELVRLLFELLAKSAAQRPASADQVARRLESVLAELIHREEPLAVADYVEDVAGDAKREQSRFVAQAIAEVENGGRAAQAPSMTPTSAPADTLHIVTVHPERRRRWAPWGAATALLASIAIFIGWRFLPEAPARAPLTEASPSPAPADLPPPASAAAPPAPAVIAPVTVVEASPTPASRRRSRTPRPHAPTKKASPEPTSLPDWVEFER